MTRKRPAEQHVVACRTGRRRSGFSSMSPGVGRLALACGLTILLGACSSTTLLYNRLDFILPWYLERYVDLDRDQAREFDGQLEPLLLWHRREELPRYLEFLDMITASLDQALTVDRVDGLTREMEVAWYRTRDRALAELLVLGESLRDEQLAEFIASLRKKQRKYEQKYLDRDDDTFREDAYDDFREFMEDYLGRLNDGQRLRVRDAVDRLYRSDDIWLTERAAWISALEQELQRAPGWQERITRMVIDWESRLDADTLALYDHNTRVVQEALVDVVNDRTDKQDRRLQRKLGGWRDDLQLLISQAPAIP